MRTFMVTYLLRLRTQADAKRMTDGMHNQSTFFMQILTA